MTNFFFFFRFNFFISDFVRFDPFVHVGLTVLSSFPPAVTKLALEVGELASVFTSGGAPDWPRVAWHSHLARCEWPMEERGATSVSYLFGLRGNFCVFFLGWE